MGQSARSRFYVYERHIAIWPHPTSLLGVSPDYCSFPNVPLALPHSCICSRFSLSLECCPCPPGTSFKCPQSPYHLFSTTACSWVISWCPPPSGPLPPLNPGSTAHSSLLVLNSRLPPPRSVYPCAVVVPPLYHLLRRESFCPPWIISKASQECAHRRFSVRHFKGRTYKCMVILKSYNIISVLYIHAHSFHEELCKECPERMKLEEKKWFNPHGYFKQIINWDLNATQEFHYTLRKYFSDWSDNFWFKKFQVFYETCGFICEYTTETINWLSVACIRSATEVFYVVLLLAFGDMEVIWKSSAHWIMSFFW